MRALSYPTYLCPRTPRARKEGRETWYLRSCAVREDREAPPVLFLLFPLPLNQTHNPGLVPESVTVSSLYRLITVYISVCVLNEIKPVNNTACNG